jgi:hypothetical protein
MPISHMLDWMKRRRGHTTQATAEAHTTLPLKDRMSGEYQSLYTHLQNRYADTVVLTFGQIEDLLGFPLPDRARTDREWWTNGATGTPRNRHSDGWLLAGRSATPNLLAQNVVFEREF